MAFTFRTFGKSQFWLCRVPGWTGSKCERTRVPYAPAQPPSPPFSSGAVCPLQSGSPSPYSTQKARAEVHNTWGTAGNTDSWRVSTPSNTTPPPPAWHSSSSCLLWTSGRQQYGHRQGRVSSPPLCPLTPSTLHVQLQFTVWPTNTYMLSIGQNLEVSATEGQPDKTLPHCQDAVFWERHTTAAAVSTGLRSDAKTCSRGLRKQVKTPSTFLPHSS